MASDTTHVFTFKATPMRSFVPFRLILDFKDEDLNDIEAVRHQGELLHDRLTAWLSEMLGGQIKVIFRESVPGSLDHRGYVDVTEILDRFHENALGVADAAGETLTEFAAAQWLVRHLSEFLNEKYKRRLTEFFAAAGIIKQAPDVEALRSEQFPLDEMIAERRERLKQSPPKEAPQPNPPKSSTYRIGLVGAVLVMLWIGLNFWQQYTSNQGLKRLEKLISEERSTSVDTEETASKENPTTPTTTNFVVRIETPAGSVFETERRDAPAEKGTVQALGYGSVITVDPNE